ncbi:MAG: helix-turn-helix domain-containing protein, partial [Mycobacterium sp.]
MKAKTQAQIDAAESEETEAAERWLDQLDPNDPDVQLDDARYLRRIRQAADELRGTEAGLRAAVAEARAHGETWGLIGMVLGISRQAAQQRFKDIAPAINRRLTDDERDMMRQLAIWSVAEQTGVSAQEAADALDDLNERVGLILEGDAHDAYMKDSEHGHVIIHVTREWLAYWAHSDQKLTREDLLRYRRQQPSRDANGEFSTMTGNPGNRKGQPIERSLVRAVGQAHATGGMEVEVVTDVWTPSGDESEKQSPDAFVDGRTDYEKLVELLTFPEGRHLDFKAELDLGSTEAKMRFVKDVVAMSNCPPGGYILIGVDDDGKPCMPVATINRASFDGRIAAELRKNGIIRSEHAFILWHYFHRRRSL